MGWRFLVDEDTHTDTAVELANRGHDAVTVEAALGAGAADARVASFASDENRVFITTDRDFLDPELRAGFRTLLVANSDADGHEIARKTDQLARLANDPAELRPITWITTR